MFKKYLFCLLSCCNLIVFATTVKVGDFNPNRADSTVAVKKALASGATKIIFNQVGFDYVVTPIELASNMELILEPGVRIVAKTNSFKDPNDVLFQARGVKNLILRGGKNSEIRMNKKDYQNRKLYKFSEWRHAIALFGCENVQIKGLKIASSGGDGIYIGRNKKQSAVSRNVLIENCWIDDNYRQGVSVISAIDLTVRNCVISNTYGTPPAAGIDFEPNVHDEHLENCLIENVTFRNNFWSAINFSVAIQNPISVTIKNCKIICGKKAPALSFCSLRKSITKGSIKVSNVNITECHSDAILFSNFGDKINYVVDMSDVNIVAAKNIKNSAQVVAFEASCKWSNAFGGASFKNVVAKGFSNELPIAFRSWKDNVRVTSVSGEIVLNNKKYDISETINSNPHIFNKETFTMPKMQISDFTVSNSDASFVKTPSPLFRTSVDVLMYAEQGENVKFTLDLRGLGRGMLCTPIKWQIIAPNGDNIPIAAYKHDGKKRNVKKTYDFKAPVAGIYTLKIPAHPNTAIAFQPQCSLKWSMAPAMSTSGVLNFIRLDYSANSTFYFEVPKNITNFYIEAGGQTGEPVNFKILDAKGKVRAVRNLLETRYTFDIKRQEIDAEIWQIKFSNASEDVCFRFSADLAPIFSVSSQYLPRQK